jgi:hypothetical protein
MLINGDPLVQQDTGPLMPTNRRFKIHLGPLTILDQKYTFNGNIKTVVKNNLKDIEQRYGEVRASRVLDFWCESLRIPSTVFDSKLHRIPHQTAYTDNFNGHGTNAALTSFGWTFDGGTGALSTDGGSFGGNTVFVNGGTDSRMHYSSALDGSDQTAWASKVVAFDNNAGLGLAVRYASGGGTFYLAHGRGTSITLYKYSSGFTALDAGGGGSQSVPRVQASGSTISSYYWNGSSWTTVNSVTDTSISAGNYAGFYVYGGDPGGALYWDDWHAEDVVGAAGQPTMRRILEERRGQWLPSYRPMEVGRQGTTIN